MDSSLARQSAVAAAVTWDSEAANGSPDGAQIQRVDEFFGCDVFGRKVMRQRLPKDAYARLMRTIELGERLDLQVADVVAAAMKDWAIERGATPTVQDVFKLCKLSHFFEIRDCVEDVS